MQLILLNFNRYEKKFTFNRFLVNCQMNEKNSINWDGIDFQNGASFVTMNWVNVDKIIHFSSLPAFTS